MVQDRAILTMAD